MLSLGFYPVYLICKRGKYIVEKCFRFRAGSVKDFANASITASRTACLASISLKLPKHVVFKTLQFQHDKQMLKENIDVRLTLLL